MPCFDAFSYTCYAVRSKTRQTGRVDLMVRKLEQGDTTR
jgi:hypothetical protein